MLPPGTRTRIAVYRLFPHIAPDVLDSMSIHMIGGMLGHDMVDPDPVDRERADDLVNERSRRAAERIAGLRERGALAGPDA